MKQILLGVLAVLGLLTQAPIAHAADTDNFRIKNYDIRYDLKRSNEGHSTLRTIETVTAEFPAYDQNRGIERALPTEYQGHTTNLEIQSVEKVDGTPWNYTTYESNDNTVVRIGDSNRYVRGEQTYVITYTQQYVTHEFRNTNSDEFYWDTNGTQWRVPIDNLSVSLAIDAELVDDLNGKTACYFGSEGEDTPCTLEQAASVFTTTARNLSAGDNVTIAVGFTPETFSEYKPSLTEILAKVWIALTVIGGVIALFVCVWLIVRWYGWSERKKDIGTIVPEYLPPKDASVSTVATIVQPRGSVFTAQLIDFAVRKYVKIYQIKKKSLFTAADFRIEIIQDPSTLTPEEREILTDIFNDPVVVGSTLELSSLKNNTSVHNKLLDNDKKLTNLIRGSYALRQKNPEQTAWFNKVAKILLIAGAVTLNPILLLAALCAYVCGITLWPLTDKGVALKRYADGMKMYIHVAEAERLQMLQSPEGAARVGGVDAKAPGQLLKLYERMLPYAILFGQEKEWSNQIGKLYEATQSAPDWYTGNTAFNAAVFATAINSFSTSATSYAAPASSSSGGSGGGGFSGGGGGGGGGGGW